MLLNRGTFVFAAATVSLALNYYFDLVAPNSFRRELVETLGDSNTLSSLGAIDRLYSKLPPDTNAWLDFANFGDESEPLVEKVYYRSCYAAYPRKIFVAPPEAVLNHGRDILRTRFQPADDWLDRHRIARTIALERAANGRINFHIADRELP
jgi:hypothetical protein